MATDATCCARQCSTQRTNCLCYAAHRAYVSYAAVDYEAVSPRTMVAPVHLESHASTQPRPPERATSGLTTRIYGALDA